MFFFPGYTVYQIKEDEVLISSKLFQNVVRITELPLRIEFEELVQNGGCMKIETELQRFLHEQELLQNEEEVRASLGKLREIMNQTLHLTMIPTEGCNFRCSYCYENHVPAFMRNETLQQIKKFIGERVSKFHSVHLGWFGGEPTLCKDVVVEMSEFMLELKKKFVFEYESTMTTNGYLLDIQLFLQLFEVGITTYQVTLDGWKHNQSRPHVSGKGTLQQITDNLKAMSQLDAEKYPFHVIIRYNILAEDEDFTWYDYLYELFGQDKRFHVALSPINDWGGDGVKEMKLLAGSKREEVLKKHYEYMKQIGLQSDAKPATPLSKICYAAYPNSYIFQADGKIGKCTVALKDEKNCIGQVEDSGIVLNEELNREWCECNITTECVKCPDVLSCLNLQCGRKKVIEGGKRFCHRGVL